MELKIEKWIYGGEGFARIALDTAGRGKALFVPFVLPGEVVSAEITEERSGFARAKLVEIRQVSAARVAPPCPYFYRCGGCQYQHADYARQLHWKRDILLETLERTAHIRLERDVQLHSAEPYQYRNRTRLKVRSAPELAIGYHRLGTHELLPVTKCPISSPLVQRAIQALWNLGSDDVGALREVQFFADHSDTKLLVEFYTGRDRDRQSLQPLVNSFREQLPEIVGIAAFPWSPGVDEENRSPVPGSKTPLSVITFGDNSLEYITAHGTFRVSAGSFFQSNRFLIDELVTTAIGGAKGATALDLYAGTGLFTLPLAARFDRVIAVEASPFSFGDLEHNAPPNVKPVQATTEKYLDKVGRGPGLDLVLLDPPRSGMGEHGAGKLGHTQVRRITYVSCDPATLARDLRVLTASGFRVESAHLIDLFPQTFHMETVVHLTR
jgi:23S rRNA (uracil1939-C5)-methyltransferase